MNKRYAKGTNGNAKGNPDSEGVDEYRKQFGVEENVHRQYKGFRNTCIRNGEESFMRVNI